MHETLTNETSGEPYAHYAIHPRMGDTHAKYWISYVYHDDVHTMTSTGLTPTVPPALATASVRTLLTVARLCGRYVYGREHARDFLARHVAPDKVVTVLTPTLPVFTCENTAGRNRTWRQIDRECTDVYWTQCCRSGLQFHNNGILCAKRVVSAILDKRW